MICTWVAHTIKAVLAWHCTILEEALLQRQDKLSPKKLDNLPNQYTREFILMRLIIARSDEVVHPERGGQPWFAQSTPHIARQTCPEMIVQMCMQHLPLNNTAWKQEKVYVLTLRRTDVLNHRQKCISEKGTSLGAEVTAWAGEYYDDMPLGEDWPKLMEMRRFLIGNMSCRYTWGVRKGQSI